MQELNELYEQAREDVRAHRERQEELAQHIEDLVEEMRREREGVSGFIVVVVIGEEMNSVFSSTGDGRCTAPDCCGLKSTHT